MNLYVVGFETVLIEQGFIVGHEWKAIDVARQWQSGVAFRRRGEAYPAAVQCVAMIAGSIAERSIANAIMNDPRNIHVCNQ